MTEKYGVIIAIENYQKDRWSKVHYAKNDAELMRRVFLERFKVPSQNLEVLIDSDATFATLQYLFGHQIPSSLDSEVYLYYAGHGFYADGQNYLTAFDTSREVVIETSVSVTPLLNRSAECSKVVLLLDTCSSDPKESLKQRSGVGDVSRSPFETIANKGQCAFYFSCSPGEHAHPCDSLKHGIWTHHLGLALEGKTQEFGLVENNQIKDVSLRNYLNQAVKNYITTKTSIKRAQNPLAILKSAGDIVLVEFDATVFSLPGSNLIKVDFESFCFQSCTFEPFASQPDFRSSGPHRHSVPERVNEKTQRFAERLKLPAVTADCARVHDLARQKFGYKLSEMALSPQGLDTPDFRYAVAIEQSEEDPSEITTTYQLIFRKPLYSIPENLQTIFSESLTELVFDKVEFPERTSLLKHLESLTETLGGEVNYWGDFGYRLDLRDGVRFYLDTERRELTFITGSGTFQERWAEFCVAWTKLAGQTL